MSASAASSLDASGGNTVFTISTQATGGMCVTYTYAQSTPVTLAFFTGSAKKESVELDWQTVSELNNSYFVVERSTNAQSFEAIGQLEGKKTTGQRQSYQFVDAKPLIGVNYYRLKQVDVSGQMVYLRPIAIPFNGNGLLNVYPSPVVDILHIDLPEITGGQEVELFNLKGQSLQHVTSSQTNLTLPLNTLAPGAYVLRVRTTGGAIYTRQVIKQ